MAFSTSVSAQLIKHNERILEKPTIQEWLGVCFCIGITIVFTFLISRKSISPPDLLVYLQAEKAPDYYYAYWCNPIFHLIALLPLSWAYLIWNIFNLAGIIWARRVFGGHPILVFFSYQLLSSLYYGQISGLLAGGLALFWWACVNRKFSLAGLGLLIALSKYQVGLLLGGTHSFGTPNPILSSSFGFSLRL